MVNITDYKDLEIKVPEKILPGIFEKQRELIRKYVAIEGKGDLIDPETGMLKNLQDPQSQWYLKDMAWRVTEEIAEMAESMLDEHEEFEHRFEEVADVIHFATELMILSGFKPEDFDSIDLEEGGVVSLEEFYRSPRSVEKVEEEDEFKESVFWAVYFLGISMNMLKSKQWKTSQVISDLERYKKRVKEFYFWLFMIPAVIGVGLEDVYKYYYKKNLANNFRLESGY
jgi:hypothetical protein